MTFARPGIGLARSPNADADGGEDAGFEGTGESSKNRLLTRAAPFRAATVRERSSRDTIPYFRNGALNRLIGKLRNLHSTSIREDRANLQVRADGLKVAGERADVHVRAPFQF